jgi:hypothetical protein
MIQFNGFSSTPTMKSGDIVEFSHMQSKAKDLDHGHCSSLKVEGEAGLGAAK